MDSNHRLFVKRFSRKISKAYVKFAVDVCPFAPETNHHAR